MRVVISVAGFCSGALLSFATWGADAVGLFGTPIITPEIEKKTWAEGVAKLPASPKKENLVPFYVSPTTANRFFIDLMSLSVDSDGVVRYVIVIQSSGGAANTSYEGMRCETRERKIYAFGRPDGSWSEARGKNWVKISDGDGNRHHAALFVDYFCPEGIIVASSMEAKRLFKNPNSQPMKYGTPGL